MPCATRSSGVRPEISFPFKITSPDFNVIIPSIAFIAVDFPAPFGPTTTEISP